jgi:hypothetical protein
MAQDLGSGPSAIGEGLARLGWFKSSSSTDEVQVSCAWTVLGWACLLHHKKRSQHSTPRVLQVQCFRTSLLSLRWTCNAQRNALRRMLP